MKILFILFIIQFYYSIFKQIYIFPQSACLRWKTFNFNFPNMPSDNFDVNPQSIAECEGVKPNIQNAAAT